MPPGEGRKRAFRAAPGVFTKQILIAAFVHSLTLLPQLWRNRKLFGVFFEDMPDLLSLVDSKSVVRRGRGDCAGAIGTGGQELGPKGRFSRSPGQSRASARVLGELRRPALKARFNPRRHQFRLHHLRGGGDLTPLQNTRYWCPSVVGGVLVSTMKTRQRRHAEDGTLASLKIGPKHKSKRRVSSRGLIAPTFATGHLLRWMNATAG
jgi:hypothetical protein